MSDTILRQKFDTAWDHLNVVQFHYEQIINQELGKQKREVSKRLSDCYPRDENGEIYFNPSGVEAAIQAIDELEKVCQEKARQWDAYRQENPVTPGHLQQQPLTDADREFITEQRKLLASVIPEVGQLDVFFETGTEGSYWSLEVDGLEGYDSLRIIRGDDRLVIYEDDGSILFDEVFIEDHQSGWEPYKQEWPYGRGQQACGGLWVHWIPKGWSSEEWAKLFNKSRGKRAELYQLKQD